MELRVCRATAFAPALATACSPPGTLDLVPRLRPLLGLSACQPLPRGPSGLQGANQRRGCPGPVGARGRALSGPAAPPRAHRPGGASAYTGIGARPVSPAALVLPRDPAPFWGSGTLHCTGSLHTGWGACTPHTHTCHGWVPRLTRPTGARHCTQLVGRTRACLRELPPGEVQGSGEVQESRAGLSAWAPLPWGSSGAGALWVPSCCPGQGWGRGLRIQ